MEGKPGAAPGFPGPGPGFREKARGEGRKLQVGAAPFRIAALAVLCALGPVSCVLLPVRLGAPVAGVVRDAQTGEPVEGALVVVRYDGSFDEVLPDRDLIGHAEAETDAEGRFRAGPIVRPGVSGWPFYRTEARVVGVLAAGYRCAERDLVAAGDTEIALEPTRDLVLRRASCRPVGARPGRADAYMTAWRELHGGRSDPDAEAAAQRLARLLDARAQLGHGAQCRGPVVDLALSPDGEHAAWLVETDDAHRVFLHDLRGDAGGAPERVATLPVAASRRLAFTGPHELVSWVPSAEPLPHSLPRAPDAARRPETLEVAWAEAPPAAPAPYAEEIDPAGATRAEPAPFDPAELADAGRARWLGRSFALAPELDPETGLPRDVLHVTDDRGRAWQIDLPGEACGRRAGFGRPHYRITADGRTGLDLRFVEGGCRVVAIDLVSGGSTRLDAGSDAATCRREDRIPATHLGHALRGWMRELEAVLRDAGVPPGSPVVLAIAESGETVAWVRDDAGEPRPVAVPRFPVATPLRRIHVSVVDAAGREGRGEADGAGAEALWQAPLSGVGRQPL